MHAVCILMEICISIYSSIYRVFFSEPLVRLQTAQAEASDPWDTDNQLYNEAVARAAIPRAPPSRLGVWSGYVRYVGSPAQRGQWAY